MLNNIETRLVNHEVYNIDESALHIVDISLKIHDDNIICTGFSKTKKQAYAKARSEVAERLSYLCPPQFINKWKIKADDEVSLQVYCCSERHNGWVNLNQITCYETFFSKGFLKQSHGFASHTDISLAAENAKNELIERYYNSFFFQNPSESSKRRFFTKKEPTSCFWYIKCQKTLLSHSLCCVEYDGNTGWGSSAGSSENETISKSLYEALAMACSKNCFGVRGNAVSIFQSNISEYDLEKIGLIYYQPLIIDGETRYTCQAVFLRD